MVKVLFVCLGNICRSPMAEFVLKDMVKNKNLSKNFKIASAATSSEALGEGVHYGTVDKLNDVGVQVEKRKAVKLKKEDYDKYDYIIGMEDRNVDNIKKIVGDDDKHKVCKLLDFTNDSRDIADPWYTGNFTVTYNDIVKGCEGFLDHLGY